METQPPTPPPPPSYYHEEGTTPLTLIDALGMGFKVGNVLKYLVRAGRKDNQVKDLEKARNYLLLAQKEQYEWLRYCLLRAPLGELLPLTKGQELAIHKCLDAWGLSAAREDVIRRLVFPTPDSLATCVALMQGQIDDLQSTH